MNILVTAIGSFSAYCVIDTLKKGGHYVVGCDIYPAEWHYVSGICDQTYKAPLATDKSYVDFIIDICLKEKVTHVIPLTDLEIDVLNIHRPRFEANNIRLCMPSSRTLEVARDKYRLFKQFEKDEAIPSIPTYRIGVDSYPEDIVPCIAKPAAGRSSEGLMRIYDSRLLHTVPTGENFILQPMVEGAVYTVDYVRSSSSGNDFSIPREELLRTKNGAGTTVRISPDIRLSQMASHIGNVLDINGCVNMEFILNDGLFYLIDINPRFSAGVAFSVKAGYDMVTSHINAHTSKDICPPINIQPGLMCKHYVEDFLQQPD